MSTDDTKRIAFNVNAIRKHVKTARGLGRETAKAIDTPFGGLMIRVKAGGHASYCVRYRVVENGKRKDVTQVLGEYSDEPGQGITLEEARGKAKEIIQLVKAGRDPVGEARQKRGDAKASLTLRDLWERRVADDDTLAPSTREQYSAYMGAHVLPVLGKKAARDVTDVDIVDVLTPLRKKSKAAAHNTKAALSGMFRFGMQRRLVERNPAAHLEGFNHVSEERYRPVEDEEIAKIWEAINKAADVTEGTKLALKLAILTGQRGIEIVGATVDELKLDGAMPLFEPAAERMKRKAKKIADRHVLPLSTQAVDLFRQAVELSKSAGDGHYVFPGHNTASKGPRRRNHLARHSLTAAMRRISKEAGVDDLRVHDMRKAITSYLAEHDEREDVLDKILHHKARGVTAKHYNHSRKLAQIQAAQQRWADRVWVVTGQTKPTSNVVAIKQPA